MGTTVKLVTGLCILVGCLPTSFGGPVRPENPSPLKKYTVNLDVAPEERWRHVMMDHKDFVKDIHVIFDAFVPKALFPLVETIAAQLDKHLPSPYAEEIKGIAKALNASLGVVTMANIVYDVSAFCTSIVSQDSNGQIWHSRNLDYPFSHILKDLTVLVDFEKDGKVLYTTVALAGYVGVLTGQKPGVFTATVDQRGTGSIATLVENVLIAMLDKNAIPSTFLVRDAFEKSTTFAEAVSLLSTTDTYSPIYYIIGGVKPGEGTVITKSSLTSDKWTLDPEHGRWFEVETNYDHWKAPPKEDNRREAANQSMKALGQKNLSVKTLYKVISTPPVLNKSTLYSVVMSAAQPDLMQVWMRV